MRRFEFMEFLVEIDFFFRNKIKVFRKCYYYRVIIYRYLIDINIFCFVFWKIGNV